MRIRSSVTAAILSSLIFSWPAAAGAQAITLKNGGFESVGGDGFPTDWTVQGPKPLPGNELRIDTTVHHSGTGSLVARHDHPASVTLMSSSVFLEVGKLYRLSGWIKTKNAVSDPTSRYPTSVAATMTMESFPFTNHAPTVGGTRDWQKIEVLFFGTQKEDRVRIHLGLNGAATGTAWFDDLRLEEVEDISEYIAPETVRWFGPAFRYTDKGWTFVHIEGEPYQRGYQYGYLLAREISAYAEKLAIRGNPDNPRQAWGEMRMLTDALMLRKYDNEYLDEMKGIADGAGKGSATIGGKAPDLLDIATVNSSVDLGQLSSALAKTTTPLSGRSFRAEEEELNTPERLHKCSSFLANGPATRDGKIVFAQLFMWNGYTGVHWDLICDVVPAKGHRFVYETFPGGIHSGSDFYINQSGVMIGETTVMQTSFNIDGTPQALRIRKAAQYGSSIDDVVRILTEKNNGLYTNDWLIADTKTDEIAILLLGTKKYKLWRSKSGEFPGGTTGFYWSVNNAKDPEVRKEFIPDPANAPFDIVFSPVNRDVAFYNYYQKEKGEIDAISAVNIVATSPLNRPHACDGKVTTSAMAEQMMFLAHYGKVTLREKFPEKNSRLISDLPNAIPHLTLGYSVVNPVFISEKLKALKAMKENQEAKPERDLAMVHEVYSFSKQLLWMNTVYPAAEADNWFVSGTAAYWNMLNNLPTGLPAALPYLRDQLAEINCRLQYTLSREGSSAPMKAERRYDGYGSYQIPRIRGTFALHQLRMLLGNDRFSDVMNGVHNSFREKPMTTEKFIAKAEEISKQVLKDFITQWLKRDDLPEPVPEVAVTRNDTGWTISLDVAQPKNPYQFLTTVSIETESEVRWQTVKVSGTATTMTFSSRKQPRRVTFNAGNDIPVFRGNFYTFSNYFDDFQHSIFVYGTSREIEANRTLASRFQTVLADQFTDIFPPLKKESEVTEAELSTSDLIVLGGTADNALTGRLAKECGLSLHKNFFHWQGNVYAEPDDGLFLALPNPTNREKVVYLFVSNSALELYQMTKRFQGMPSWALFRGDQVIDRGFHQVEGFEIELKNSPDTGGM